VQPRLLFTGGDDAFSVLVRGWTGSYATHAAIVIGDQVLHAVGKGVILEMRSALRTRYGYYDVAELEVLPDVSEGLRLASAQVGRRYDNLDVASRLLFVALRGLLPWTARRAVNTPGAWTCARFCMLLDPIGDRIPEWRHVDRTSVTPVDLLAVAGPSFRRVG